MTTLELNERLDALTKSNKELLEAAEEVVAWYIRDGSVGGACDPMDRLEAAIASAKGTK